MPTESARQALSILRDGSQFQWYVIPLLAVVLYLYAAEVERRNWNLVFAGLALWGMDWFNEIWNSLFFHFSGRAPVFADLAVSVNTDDRGLRYRGDAAASASGDYQLNLAGLLDLHNGDTGETIHPQGNDEDGSAWLARWCAAPYLDVNATHDGLWGAVSRPNVAVQLTLKTGAGAVKAVRQLTSWPNCQFDWQQFRDGSGQVIDIVPGAIGDRPHPNHVASRRDHARSSTMRRKRSTCCFLPVRRFARPSRRRTRWTPASPATASRRASWTSPAAPRRGATGTSCLSTKPAWRRRCRRSRQRR